MTMTEEPFVGWEWVTEIYEGYPTLQIAPTLFNFDGIKSQTARMDPHTGKPSGIGACFPLKGLLCWGEPPMFQECA